MCVCDHEHGCCGAREVQHNSECFPCLCVSFLTFRRKGGAIFSFKDGIESLIRGLQRSLARYSGGDDSSSSSSRKASLSSSPSSAGTAAAESSSSFSSNVTVRVLTQTQVTSLSWLDAAAHSAGSAAASGALNLPRVARAVLSPSISGDLQQQQQTQQQLKSSSSSGGGGNETADFDYVFATVNSTDLAQILDASPSSSSSAPPAAAAAVTSLTAAEEQQEQQQRHNLASLLREVPHTNVWVVTIVFAKDGQATASASASVSASASDSSTSSSTSSSSPSSALALEEALAYKRSALHGFGLLVPSCVPFGRGASQSQPRHEKDLLGVIFDTDSFPAQHAPSSPRDALVLTVMMGGSRYPHVHAWTRQRAEQRALGA